MIYFVIPGEPQGKARPKFARRGNYVTTYTPDKTKKYEALVATQCKKCMGDMPMLEGALQIIIHAFFPVPKSASKKKTDQMLCGEMLPTKKPDFDNIAKVVCDALNGIAYKDDAQIVLAQVYKAYGYTPEITVLIDSITERRMTNDTRAKN